MAETVNLQNNPMHPKGLAGISAKSQNNPLHPKGRNGFRIAEYANPFGRAGAISNDVMLQIGGTKLPCRRATEMMPRRPGHAG